MISAYFEQAISLIRVERKRQIEEEGYTPEHDQEHQEHEALVLAGASYEMEPKHRIKDVPLCWPFAPSLYKPSEDRIRELVKAGALYMAAKDLMEAKEIDIPLKQAVCEKIDEMAEMIATLLAKKEVSHV